MGVGEIIKSCFNKVLIRVLSLIGTNDVYICNSKFLFLLIRVSSNKSCIHVFSLMFYDICKDKSKHEIYLYIGVFVNVCL